MKGCLRITKFIWILSVYKRKEKFRWNGCWIYILFSILMENNIFDGFSPKFLLETLETILETKISVKKLLNILFSIWMENNILLVYIYSFFSPWNFSPCPAICIYIYIWVVSEWLRSWVLQIFDPRWLNNPVILTSKVNSTYFFFSDEMASGRGNKIA